MFHEVPIMSNEVPTMLHEVPIMFHEAPIIFHEVSTMFHEVHTMFHRVLVFPLLGCGCAHNFPHLGLGFARMWFHSVFPWSWFCLCWAVVIHMLPLTFAELWFCSGCPGLGLAVSAVFMHRIPLVFILLLLGFGYEKASPGFCLAFVGLWFCLGFSCSWSCHCWAVVVYRFPLVLVFPLLG